MDWKIPFVTTLLAISMYTVQGSGSWNQGFTTQGGEKTTSVEDTLSDETVKDIYSTVNDELFNTEGMDEPAGAQWDTTYTLNLSLEGETKTLEAHNYVKDSVHALFNQDREKVVFLNAPSEDTQTYLNMLEIASFIPDKSLSAETFEEQYRNFFSDYESDLNPADTSGGDDDDDDPVGIDDVAERNSPELCNNLIRGNEPVYLQGEGAADLKRVEIYNKLGQLIDQHQYPGKDSERVAIPTNKIEDTGYYLFRCTFDDNSVETYKGVKR